MIAENYLEELGEKYKPTKRNHNYLKHYWRHFGDIRLNAKNVMEIGVQTGSSLHMWAEFFPEAMIYGVDIDETCRKFEGERIKICISSSTDSAAMHALAREAGGTFDVIIDDGSHYYGDQIDTFKNLFPFVNDGGFYAAEDLGVAQGVHRQIAVNAFQELIDGINYFPKNMTGSQFLDVTTFSDVENYLIKEVVGISFYRYLAIIEKGKNPESNKYLKAFHESTPPEARPPRRSLSFAERCNPELAAKYLALLVDLRRRKLIPRGDVKPPGMLQTIMGRLIG